MRADFHPGPRQLTQARAVEVAALPEPPGKREELRGQPALDKPRQRDFDVGFVAVIEREVDVGALADGVEHLLELLDGDPALVLARVQRACRTADPVQCKVHRHHARTLTESS